MYYKIDQIYIIIVIHFGLDKQYSRNCRYTGSSK